MAVKRRSIEVRKLYRPGWVAKQFGIPVATIHMAIRRGHMKSETTGCGQHLISKNQFANWIDQEGLTFRGRPRGEWMDQVNKILR